MIGLASRTPAGWHDRVLAGRDMSVVPPVRPRAVNTVLQELLPVFPPHELGDNVSYGCASARAVRQGGAGAASRDERWIWSACPGYGPPPIASRARISSGRSAPSGFALGPRAIVPTRVAPSGAALLESRLGAPRP